MGKKMQSDSQGNIFPFMLVFENIYFILIAPEFNGLMLMFLLNLALERLYNIKQVKNISWVKITVSLCFWQIWTNYINNKYIFVNRLKRYLVGKICFGKKAD